MDFFSKEKKPCKEGMPKEVPLEVEGAAETRGRPPTAVAPGNALVLGGGGGSAVVAPSVKRQKRDETSPRPPRMNWGVGEAFERLSKAIDDWEEKKGESREGESQRDYCARVDVPRVSPVLLLCAC